MNMLNSIILEGNVVGKATVEVVNEASVTNFQLKVVRETYNESGEVVYTNEYKFNVETYGKLAEICAEKLTDNRGVRVVGYLKETNGNISIVAEHIEFKLHIPKETEE